MAGQSGRQHWFHAAAPAGVERAAGKTFSHHDDDGNDNEDDDDDDDDSDDDDDDKMDHRMKLGEWWRENQKLSLWWYKIDMLNWAFSFDPLK